MNQEDNMNKKGGFTLIELLLAMTFISILLLAISMTIVQIATIYNKGTLTKDLNQVSREISDELTSAIGTSGTFSDDDFISDGAGTGGRLCTGKYSYVWNYASALNGSAPNDSRTKFSTATPALTTLNTLTVGATTRNEISFVKVIDAGSTLCTKLTGGSYPPVDRTKATELLRTGDHAFELHYLNVSSVSADSVSAQKLYTVTYVLGTSTLSALDATAGAENTTCKQSGTGADINYCSVQKFTLVLRVANGVN